MSSQVLLISDTDDITGVIRDVIKDMGHSPVVATTIDEAIAAIPVEVVILDTISERFQDPDVLDELTTQLTPSLIPVIALTASVTNVGEIGPRYFDFIARPFARHEVEARVSAALRAKEFQDRLRKATTLDPATSMLNRVSGENRVAEEISRAVRYGRSLACTFARFEPEPSEEVIQEIGRIFTESTRLSDVMCRWERNVILMILPETGPFGAARVAENLRKQCAALSTAAAAIEGDEFMSYFGTAGFIEGDDCESLIGRASDAAADALGTPESPVVLARVAKGSDEIRFLRI
ncbi:MAG: hypothetical protein DCC49_09645 [Acidobacteria bacterium]|nr:MAG: hypothetical protein DCC49_09645 [Acidobacteriota bacterium]